jgi:hypothetical protein
MGRQKDTGKYSHTFRERLKAEMMEATPYSRSSGIKSVLRRHGVPSLAVALNIIGVRTMAELYTGNANLYRTLKTIHLRLENSVLYAPHLGGRHNPDHQWHLTPEELQALTDTPVPWIKGNVERIKAILTPAIPCKQGDGAIGTQTDKPVPPAGKRLTAKYHALTRLISAIHSGANSDELRLIGSQKNVILARRLAKDPRWEEKAFAPSELRSLGIDITAS